MKKIILVLSAIALSAVACNSKTNTQQSLNNQTQSAVQASPTIRHYSSDRLGVSFDYVDDAYQNKIEVTEDGNRINLGPYNYLDVYTKSPSQSLKGALIAQFSLKNFPNCQVVTDKKDPNKANLQGRPEDPIGYMMSDCPNDEHRNSVGSSNYIGYFYQDPISKSRYVFINGGQDPISATLDESVTKKKTWYETLKFK